MKNKIMAFNIATRKGNFEILKLLPNDIKGLQDKLKISRMPMNKRVNDLENIGLVIRERGFAIIKGSIKLTKLGEEVIKQIENGN